MSVTYYAVVNDAPMLHFARKETVVICGDPNNPEHLAIYGDRAQAVDARDALREANDNPELNVYRLTLEPVGGEA